MKTLIVYDNEGYILYQQSGIYRIPVGIPYLEVEIQEGYFAVSVDTKLNKVILEEKPKSQIDIIEEEVANINYALMVGGLL